MKILFYRLYWIYWKLTGYREICDLLRSLNLPNDALTPTGMQRLEELAEKEVEIRRKMKGIQ